MKKIIPFLLLWSGLLSAQEPITIRVGCSFDGEEHETEYYSFDPSDEATQIVNRIVQSMGLSAKSFTIKESNVKNALATTEGRDRYILYSTAFLEKFKGDAKTKWAAYTVLAHEIGHHLNNHDFNEKEPKKRKSMELEADRFAGSVCRTLGATLEEALAGMESMQLPGETPTHPVKSARVAAVANGWKKQDELLRSTGAAPVSGPMIPPSPSKESKPLPSEPRRSEPTRSEPTPGGGNVPATVGQMETTPRRIFEKYLAAIGGQGKLNQIRDVEIIADIEIGEMSLESRMCYKKHGKYLEQIMMNGEVVSERRCNGSRAFVNNINTGPYEATGNELRDLIDMSKTMISEMEYVNAPNGYTFSYLGTERINDRNAQGIKIVRNNSTTLAYYDIMTNLKVREETWSKDAAGNPITSTTYFSNYQWANGIFQPYLQQGQHSNLGEMSMSVRSFFTNQNLSDALFSID